MVRSRSTYAIDLAVIDGGLCRGHGATGAHDGQSRQSALHDNRMTGFHDNDCRIVVLL